MTTRVTQCPKCHTSFRVTEAQLKIANGAVRCGSCLHIFHAPDYWLGVDDIPSPETANESISAEPQPSIEEPFNNYEDSDQPSSEPDSFDLLLEEQEFDEQELDEQELDEQELETSFIKPDALKSLDDEPEPEFSQVIEQSSLDDIFDDNFTEEIGSALIQESDTFLEDSIPLTADREQQEPQITEEDEEDTLISDGLEDIDDSPEDDDQLFGDTGQFQAISSIDEYSSLDDSELPEEQQNTGEFSDTFLEIDSWEPTAKRVFKDLDELGEETRGDEEAWAKKLLEEDDEILSATDEDEEDEDEDEYFNEAEEDQFQDVFEHEEEHEQFQLDPELLDVLDENDQPEKQQAIVEDEFILSDEPVLAGERIGQEKRRLLANIEPEPVVFATGIDRNSWVRRGWIAGIVLALLALASQYVIFNFDRLAHDNSYRNSLARVCSIIGCKLPERDDIRLIRATNLMVRSHPKANNALVVDAIITNRADFAQQFPDLELIFTNLNGDVVAGRRFTPGEYLSGELAGQNTMPSKQPIHVALEIIDPGQEAVNYQLHFYSQQDR